MCGRTVRKMRMCGNRSVRCKETMCEKRVMVQKQLWFVELFLIYGELVFDETAPKMRDVGRFLP